jgi:hypothetical protein
MMGAPSKLSVIRKAAAFARARPTLLLAGQRQPRGGGGRIHDLRLELRVRLGFRVSGFRVHGD